MIICFYFKWDLIKVKVRDVYKFVFVIKFDEDLSKVVKFMIEVDFCLFLVGESKVEIIGVVNDMVVFERVV